MHRAAFTLSSWRCLQDLCVLVQCRGLSDVSRIPSALAGISEQEEGVWELLPGFIQAERLKEPMGDTEIPGSLPRVAKGSPVSLPGCLSRHLHPAGMRTGMGTGMAQEWYRDGTAASQLGLCWVVPRLIQVFLSVSLTRLGKAATWKRFEAQSICVAPIASMVLGTVTCVCDTSVPS